MVYGFSVANGIVHLVFLFHFFVFFLALAYLPQHVSKRGVVSLGGETAGEEAEEEV